MEQMKTVIQSSVIFRLLAALCGWFSRQWAGSGLIQWFIHPRLGLEQAQSESSVFYRLWRIVHGALCKIYEVLCLDKLFSGSLIVKSWLWCGAAAVLAPILPTMAVLGLALVGCACLLVDFMSDRGRELFYAPVNRYIWLYAAIYAVGTLFSVTLKGSLLGGVLTAPPWPCTASASTCLAGATSPPPGWTATCSATSASGCPPLWRTPICWVST